MTPRLKGKPNFDFSLPCPYPMNPSEDSLSLGGSQLLYLCSCSLIFAVVKAPTMAAVKTHTY